MFFDKHDRWDTLASGILTALNLIIHPKSLSKCHLEFCPCRKEWLLFAGHSRHARGHLWAFEMSLNPNAIQVLNDLVRTCLESIPLYAQTLCPMSQSRMWHGEQGGKVLETAACLPTLVPHFTSFVALGSYSSCLCPSSCNMGKISLPRITACELLRERLLREWSVDYASLHCACHQPMIG